MTFTVPVARRTKCAAASRLALRQQMCWRHRHTGVLGDGKLIELRKIVQLQQAGHVNHRLPLIAQGLNVRRDCRG